METSTPALRLIVKEQQYMYSERLDSVMRNENSKTIISDCSGQIGNLMVFSTDGKYLMISELKEKVTVFDTAEHKVIKSLAFRNVQNMYISEANKYALVMDKNTVDSFDLYILRFPSLETIKKIEHKRYKKEQWPLVRFINRDKYLVFIVNQNLQIYQDMKLLHTLDVGVSEYFSCQPLHENFLVACFSLKKELVQSSTSGFLRLYSPSKTAQPIFERDVPDASEIELKWSPNGQSLVMTKSSNSDSTNQSYYGQTYVYLYDWSKRDFTQIPTYDGPVHAVEWSPDSENFIVISGFMPAGCVLFNKDGKPKFEFGKDHKNTIYWSPLRRFVLLCGFGNLDGSIEVWDTHLLKLVGRCKDKSASLCAWSPCGRRFLTAKVTPRMNVDNGFKVFDYQGAMLTERTMQGNELYEVQFMPVHEGLFTDRVPSPPRSCRADPKKNEEPTKKLFVPVGGSGQLAEQLRMMKSTEGARVLSSNETFGNSQTGGLWGLQRQNKVPPSNFPPGFVPPPEKKEKKKRIRNNNNKRADDGEY